MPAPARVLVVKLATLGDVLTMTPTLRAIRTTFPAAHIGVLTTLGGAQALRGLDSYDEVVTFDKFAFDRPRDAWRSLPTALGLARDLRARKWDTLLLLHHLTTPFGIAKYAALSLGSGAPRRVGLENGRGRWFLTDGAEDRGFGWQHEVDYALSVASVLGARHPTTPRLELEVTPEDDQWAAAHLPVKDAVLLVPGSGSFSRARRWAPDRFSEVGRQLSARHGLAPVVLSGLAEDEQVLALQVASGTGPATRIAPAAPTPQTLGALVRRCRLVVANDGGVVHVATAVGTPVVAIFGPSNAAAWGPYPAQDPRHQVVREQLACSPCIHRGHSFGTPQGCPARTCLALIEPSAVVRAAERALGVDERLAVPA
ncbi:MAG: glycosyltransferase family 9 protein [Chloroflexi bacterium]|nr:glycosyltransferase family 9 protein [Chloroflexota bacterium]